MKRTQHPWKIDETTSRTELAPAGEEGVEEVGVEAVEVLLLLPPLIAPLREEARLSSETTVMMVVIVCLSFSRIVSQKKTDKSLRVFFVFLTRSCTVSFSFLFQPDWVFEEQFVVSNSEEAAAWVGMRDARMYLVEEKCLCFGSVIANGNMMRTGLQERIRIGNPKSVPAEVTMELRLTRDATDMKLVSVSRRTLHQTSERSSAGYTDATDRRSTFLASVC